MRSFIVLLVLLLMVGPAFSLPTISGKPTERWFSDNTNLNPLYKWIQAADGLIEAGMSLGTGSVYYVDSGVTTAGNGLDWDNAVATLDEAVNLCTANAGDIILIAQGHTETMGAAADEVDIDIHGVTVIGIGNADLRPIFDYTGTTTGAFAIGADNVTVYNLRFRAHDPDVNEAIDVEAGSTGVSILGCLFDTHTPGTDEFTESIDSPGAASDRLTVQGCVFYMGGGNADAAIEVKDSDHMLIVDNLIYGDFGTACLNQITSACIHITVKGNVMFNGTVGGTGGLNAQPCMEFVATTSGVIQDNYLGCNVAADDNAIVGADMFLFENIYTETEGTGVGISTAAG